MKNPLAKPQSTTGYTVLCGFAPLREILPVDLQRTFNESPSPPASRVVRNFDFLEPESSLISRSKMITIPVIASITLLRISNDRIRR